MRRNDREIADKNSIAEIIQKADVCRIALVDGNMPYIVAMNFGFKEGDPSVLYFHCANSGRKLDIIKNNNNVCFQMDIGHELIVKDKACGCTMKFNSVVGSGKIYKVEDTKGKIEGLNQIMKQYTGKDNYSYEDKMLDITTILRLEIKEISAKKKE